MNQTNTHKIFSKINPNIDYENFRFSVSGKLATSLILKYVIKKHDIDHKLSEILVPKLMGTWVYSSMLQNIQIGHKFSKYTKILYIYHQFGIPQKFQVNQFAEENDLLIIEDCAHVLKANLDNGKSDILGSEYSIFSFSKFIDCQPLGGLYSSDKNFIAFVDEEINNSGIFQSVIINTLVKLSKLSKSNELLSRKFYHMNYSLWNFPSKNIKSKIRKFNKNIFDEMNSRNTKFNLFKNEIKDVYYQDYFNYDELVCQKLPLVINDKKIVTKIIEKFEHYGFPFEVLAYDKNRNFLDPQFEKTIILDHSGLNPLFEKQIELIKDLK